MNTVRSVCPVCHWSRSSAQSSGGAAASHVAVRALTGAQNTKMTTTAAIQASADRDQSEACGAHIPEQNEQHTVGDDREDRQRRHHPSHRQFERVLTKVKSRAPSVFLHFAVVRCPGDGPRPVVEVLWRLVRDTEPGVDCWCV